MYSIAGIDFFRFMIMTIINTTIIGAGLYSGNNAKDLSEILVKQDSNTTANIALSFSKQDLALTIIFFVVSVTLYFLAIWYYRKRQVRHGNLTSGSGNTNSKSK